jgi:hypothetical protein
VSDTMLGPQALDHDPAGLSQVLGETGSPFYRKYEAACPRVTQSFKKRA